LPWALNGDDRQHRSGPGSELRLTGMKLGYCMLIGLALTGALVWITEYYTGTNYRPVQSIARASQTGHGTNVIQGLAISLESTALPTLVIVVAVIASLPARRSPRRRLRAPRCWRWPAWWSRSTPTVRSPTMPAASPKWRAFPTTCASAPTRSTRSATPPRR
jgi:hypothetical protein